MAFWKRWASRRSRVRSDAADLIHEYGDRALTIVEHMARAERIGRLLSPALPRGHWGHVRREVKRAIARPRQQP